MHSPLVYIMSGLWGTLKEKFNTTERCDRPSCVEGVTGRKASLVYPPDRAQIGRANWIYVHTRAANFPVKPSKEEQEKELQWIHSFVYTYPCGLCARDFASICARIPPVVHSRLAYEKWWVIAHNEVNKDLSKPQFKSK